MRITLLALASSVVLVAAEAFAQSTPPAEPTLAPAASASASASASAPAPASASASAHPAPPPPEEDTSSAIAARFWRRAPAPPAGSWLVSGLLGVEIEARGGIMVPDGVSPVLAPGLYPSRSGDPTGDILRGAEKPYGYTPFGLSFTAGYRLLPFLSAGIFFDYASFQANDNTSTGSADGTTQLQRQAWQLGAYGRYYFTTLSRTLHPWVELGLGYTGDTASYVRGSVQGPTGPTTEDYYLTYRGLSTNLRAGLDVRIAPAFSLGPALGYGRVFALGGCVDAEPQTDAQNTMTSLPAVNTCDSSKVQAGGYGVFFGGIFAKVTLGPDVR